ncbi:hypothetical protein ACVQ92_00800 [Staphylococcus aureus]
MANNICCYIDQPGPGVGGHCLAVDPYFIIAKYLKRKVNSNWT